MDAANRRADTIASAIEINRPVNLPKACGHWSAAAAWSAR